MAMQKAPATKTKFTTYQAVVITLLALTQFTVVLDFMVMSPLGDMLMKSMGLTHYAVRFCRIRLRLQRRYFGPIDRWLCR
jgi:hypothetical protein